MQPGVVRWRDLRQARRNGVTWLGFPAFEIRETTYAVAGKLQYCPKNLISP
jgi:hypothetical protein